MDKPMWLSKRSYSIEEMAKWLNETYAEYEVVDHVSLSTDLLGCILWANTHKS